MKLIIELLSDTCIGNGTGHGAFVDNDTYYHDNGLPYIPTKRIKGILRETAKDLLDWNLLNQNEFDDMFSGGGEGFTTKNKLRIYDAEVENYEELCKEIASSDKYTKERVLGYYTYLRYSTAMENGVALKDTLRSMRAVKKGTKFVADVYDCDIEVLKKICKAVRHIGMNRTRGYGEVKLSVIDTNASKTITFPKLDDDTYYRLLLNVHNVSPIVISKGNITSTVDYIAGTSVRGYFASKYLKDHDADDRFESLFINEDLCFEDGYISNHNYDIYEPVSLSLAKIKDTDNYYDKTLEAPDNQLTRVTGKYVNNEIHDIRTPLKEVIYHHTRPDDKSIGHVISNEEGKGTFYQLEVLSANQYFVLPVRGKGKDLKELAPYVNDFMTIGKSKGTQYGKIIIESITEKHDTKKVSGEVYAKLMTDTVIYDHNYEPTLSIAELVKAIGGKRSESFVGYTKLTGYNAKWNLPKPVINAFKAGSVLVLDVDEVNEDIYIGECQSVGCGYIHLTPLNDVIKNPKYDYEEYTVSKSITKNSELYKYVADIETKESILSEVLKKTTGKPCINPTTIGRVLLMSEDGDYTQFNKNIEAIKDRDKQDLIVKEVEQAYSCVDSLNLSEKEKEEYKIYAVREYFIQLKYESRKKAKEDATNE